MRDLNLSISEIGGLTVKRIKQYLIILDEINSIEKEKMKEAQK